ncbi:MAG: LTA synthase family protein [Bacteroidales bacterium]|nr:LTA synthase family protein [Bacteroidales bacterium]
MLRPVRSKKVSWAFILLLTLSMVILMMLHFLQWKGGVLEEPLERTSWVNCLFFCMLDVTLLFAFSMLVFWGRSARALALTFGLSWVVSYTNVVYGRFFNAYIPLTALTEVRNFTDASLLGSLSTAFRPVDLYYLLALILFAGCCRWLARSKKIHSPLRSLLAMWAFYGVLMIPAYYNQATHTPMSAGEIFKRLALPTRAERLLYPNFYQFHSGMARSWMAGGISVLFPKQLTTEERAEIETVADPALHGTRLRTAPPQIKNVIFILVESYLSLVSDRKVGEVEVTPFLNRLRHSEGVYYNGRVTVNITMGESADGQLIYMTGMLPLRSEISVSRLLNKTLPGLPGALGFAPEQARAVIPTGPCMWQQDRLGRTYGFGHLYSKLDFPDKNSSGHVWNLYDEQIFSLARMQDDKEKSEPFFSLVLTISMHSTYVTISPYATDFAFTSGTDEYPEKFYNYLACCRYTDACIKDYFDYLKESGLYDKSLIVIVSDHQARDVYMDMGGQLPTEIPLYIVNGGIRGASSEGEGIPAWDGPCNQIDVYPTILDIMGADSQWRGLGCSLLMDEWKDFTDNKTWTVSENIIYGDYFATIQ